MCPGQNPFHMHVYWYDTSCFIGQDTSLGGQILFIETHINNYKQMFDPSSAMLSPIWLVVSNIFIFRDTWDNPSHWRIFFKMVKTTNQLFFLGKVTIFPFSYVPQGPVQRPGTSRARRLGAALGRATGPGATQAVAGGDGEGDGMMFTLW